MISFGYQDASLVEDLDHCLREALGELLEEIPAELALPASDSSRV
jgi:hypothetical protein